MLKKDIRVQKNELRDKMKRFRREMPPLVKQKKDMAIRRGVQSLKQYQACQTLLTFVSTDIEVDTRGLIGQALRDGKRVAVPYCVDGTRQMDFLLYPINERPCSPHFWCVRAVGGEMSKVVR